MVALGRGLKAKGVKPRNLAGSRRPVRGKALAKRISRPISCVPVRATQAVRRLVELCVLPRFRSRCPTGQSWWVEERALVYSTYADVRGHPLSVADSQGQVAHTRGSGETVAASPSDEEQMAIIFLQCGLLRALKC